MNREQLLLDIAKLPPKTEIFVRGGVPWSDDAWSFGIRVFEYQGQVSAFLCPRGDNHTNFPERYSGVREITCQYEFSQT